MRHSEIKRLLCSFSLILTFSSCSGNVPLETDTYITVISQTETSAFSGAETPPPVISENDDIQTEASAAYTEAASDTNTVCAGVSSGYEDTGVTTGDILSASSDISSAQTEIQTAPLTTVKTDAAAPKTTTSAAKKKTTVTPEIKVPSADGKKVINGSHSKIDYSNASEGYIAASCSGSGGYAKLRVTCGDLQYDHDMTADGKYEYIPLMGSGSYTVKIYEHISGRKYSPVLEGSFEAKVRNDTVTYLYPNKYVNFNKSSECVKKAAELCDGKDSDIERIAAIFDYIVSNVTYDKKLAANVQNGYIPDPDSTLSSKKGICFDYSSLFAAMCRSQGIPARIVVGYAEPNIYHAWNEVYTDKTGWITPEVFLKKKGYNRSDATFYTGRSDKKKAAEYIADEKNYSAMYRY